MFEQMVVNTYYGASDKVVEYAVAVVADALNTMIYEVRLNMSIWVHAAMVN
jgi:hypothetical protein